ncbi:MAG: head-tail connector protein [Hyphomicrobium sp.]
MALVLTSGPALEPVTVAEAKAHLRVDGDAEDTLIASLILTSRLHVEAALDVALITQSWRLQLDRWPRSGELQMPMRPLQSIDEVRVLSAAGDPTIVAAGTYAVDVAGTPPRLVRLAGVWPLPGRTANGIEIDFTAGYGAAATDVPANVRQALLLLIAHWYEHRDPIEVGAADVAVPPAVSELLAPLRIARL